MKQCVRSGQAWLVKCKFKAFQLVTSDVVVNGGKFKFDLCDLCEKDVVFTLLSERWPVLTKSFFG